MLLIKNLWEKRKQLRLILPVWGFILIPTLILENPDAEAAVPAAPVGTNPFFVLKGQDIFPALLHPLSSMKKHSIFLCIVLTGIFSALLFNACGEKKKTQAELITGNWAQLKNKAHVLLITSPTGEWESIVRIPDDGLKIVKSKKNAKGTWHIEKGQMSFAVVESEIEDVWAKNSAISYNIVELTENKIRLKDESGLVTVWTRTDMGKTVESEGTPALSIPMAPVVVNINKNRANDKDRYLCLKMNIKLKELMPDEKPPPVHSKIHDTVITFFSSLLYDDVKDFNGIRVQSQKLAGMLNPHMEGMIKEIQIENVIVTAEMDKVEEFMTVNSHPVGTAAEKGKEGKNGKKETEGKEKPKH